MFGTPTMWLGGALAICLALFVAGAVGMYRSSITGARNEGVAIGTGAASKTVLETATKAAEIERVAEETIPLTAERRALIAICNRSASCEERGKYR